MKNKTSLILLIFLFLLIVAVVFVVLSSLDKKLNPPDTPVEEVEAEYTELVEPSSPEPIEATEVSAETSTPVPETPEPVVPTMAPFPVVETPVPSTVPMPVPTEKPGDPLGSGSFKSNTRTGLDVRADWSAETFGAESAKVRVTVYVDSWSLILNAAEKTVNLSLNGQYVSMDAPSVVHRENKALSTEIGSATFVIPLAEGGSFSQDLQVEWHYNGTYGGMSIPSIECGGTIELSR